jgi:hypothetical protein
MASEASVPSILCLSNYAYKCHYLPNSNNIYKFSHNYKYDGTRHSNDLFLFKFDTYIIHFII